MSESPENRIPTPDEREEKLQRDLKDAIEKGMDDAARKAGGYLHGDDDNLIRGINEALQANDVLRDYEVDYFNLEERGDYLVTLREKSFGSEDEKTKPGISISGWLGRPDR